MPIFKSIRFKSKHVKKYKEVKTQGVHKFDPLTMLPLQDNDLVVCMDNNMMLYDTWKYLRSKGDGALAKDHSEFFEQDFKGSFFSQKGVYKQLNWLWFGALGGFLTWVLRTYLHRGWQETLNAQLNYFNTEQSIISNTLATEIIVGFSAGLGLITALALVEELGQARRFDLSRVILRILIGVPLSALVFFGVSLFGHYFLDSYKYLNGLIAWTLLGTMLGLILTIFSSIELKNGLKGGSIASILSYQAYFFLEKIPVPFLSEPLLVELISQILFGAILGLIIMIVVAFYEDYELKFLAPAAFKGKVVSISKWLKSNQIEYITIGSAPGAEVNIKKGVDPKIAPTQAILFTQKKQVVLKPKEATFLNGKPLTGEATLQDGDLIHFGNGSTTRLKFLAKQKDSNKIKPSGPPKVVHSSKKSVTRSRIKAVKRTQPI